MCYNLNWTETEKLQWKLKAETEIEKISLT